MKEKRVVRVLTYKQAFVQAGVRRIARDRSMFVDDDAELIERYLQGERAAASLLVARHSPSLFGWLRWKTGSREDAEDLTQIVWSKALPALGGLADRAALRAWLFAIMRREFTGWLRARRVVCSLDALRETGGDIGGAASLQPISDALATALDRVALQNALAQLSEEHRDTFMLRYLSQFSAPETAMILDIPVGTVESRCHFARERLREYLLCAEQPQSGGAHAVEQPAPREEEIVVAAPSPRHAKDKKTGFRGYLR